MPFLLDDEQLHEIKAIIEKYHSAVVLKVVGPEALSKDEYEKLKETFKDESSLNAIKDSYLYGQIVGKLHSTNVANMSYEEFQKEVKDNPTTLSEAERLAVEAAQHSAGTYIRNLGAKVVQQANSVILEEDQVARASLLEGVQTEVAQNIARREGLGKLKKRLSALGEDRTRDWTRVAVTEKHNAMQLGLADAIAKQHGNDELVFKRPMPDACPRCRSLHLGPDGHPRIFKLSYLQSNGTNVGVKANDWKPVIGAVHPHCHPAGTMILTPEGERAIEDIRPGDAVVAHDGSVQKATHCWANTYSGEMIELDFGDRRLHATPNHRLFGEKGWIEAGLLERGQDLRNVWLRVGTSGEPKTQDGPVAERSRFLRVLSFLSRTGMPVTAIDFNGDFFVWKGEVDVEDSDGRRDFRLFTNTDQGVVQNAFVGRPELTPLGLRYAGLVFERVGTTPPGLVCGSSVGLPTGCVADCLGSTGASDTDACSKQAIANGATSDAESTSYLLLREILVDVHTDDSFDRKVDARLGHCRIVNVTSRKFNGTVYNLSVTSTESYIANGVASHNCQCQLSRIPEGWGFNEDGDMVPGGEYGTLYEDPDDAEKSMKLEATLQKAFVVKSRIDWSGLPIAIEHPVGSHRPWRDAQGNTQYTVMKNAYGYVEGTLGPDGDEYDVFLGPDPKASLVYIIHTNRPDAAVYDEDKAMLGFSNPNQAKQAFLDHYTSPHFFGSMTVVPFEEFKAKLLESMKPGSMLHDGMMKADVTIENRRAGDTGVNLLYSDIRPSAHRRRADVTDLPPPEASTRIVKDKNLHKLTQDPDGLYQPVQVPERFHIVQSEPRDHIPGNMEMVKQRAREKAQGGAMNVVDLPDPTKAEEKPLKKGSFFIGPKGGKWADPQHTVPYKESKGRSKAAPEVAGQVSFKEHGVEFKTGQSVTFTFGRNTTPAPKAPKGAPDKFQQKIEPSGRYMIALPKGTSPLPGQIVDDVTFKNPLVIKGNTGDSGNLYDENSWKANLSKAFGGKKGKALSKAVAEAGYDGIVTANELKGQHYSGEIVDLRFLHSGVVEKSLSKALFLGPRGGKYADAKLTIPYREGKVKVGKKLKPRPPGHGDPKKPPKQWKKGYPPGIPPAQIKSWDVGKRGGTEQKHWNLKTGDFKEKRKQLHQNIKEMMVGKIESVPEGQQPEAIVTMGGPASGKSTLVRKINESSNFSGVVVDPDFIKEQLPEYKAGIAGGWKNAAKMVHAESSTIAEEVRKEALAKRANIVLDTTGANEKKFLKRIQELKAAGYKIRLVMSFLDKDTALMRARKRAEETGRYVPDEIVLGVAEEAPKNFAKAAALADEAHLFDNSSREPVLLYQKDGDSHKVHEQSIFGTFTGLQELSASGMSKAMMPEAKDILDWMKQAHAEETREYEKLYSIERGEVFEEEPIDTLVGHFPDEEGA